MIVFPNRKYQIILAFSMCISILLLHNKLHTFSIQQINITVFCGVGNLFISLSRNLEIYNIIQRPCKIASFKISSYRFVEVQVLPVIVLAETNQIVSQASICGEFCPSKFICWLLCLLSISLLMKQEKPGKWPRTWVSAPARKPPAQFQAPSFSIDQPQKWGPFGQWTNKLQVSFCLFFSL